MWLTRANGLDWTVGAALFVEGIVKNEWGVTSWRLATLGVGGATAIRLALGIIIEHGARPEHVVVVGVNGLGGNVFLIIGLSLL